MKVNDKSSSNRRWAQRYRSVLRRKENQEYEREIRPTQEELNRAYIMIMEEAEKDRNILMRQYDDLINSYVKQIRMITRGDRSYTRWNTEELSSFLSAFKEDGGDNYA